jgi:hypothetical protein
MLAGYCAGWSLRTLLTEGLNGVSGKATLSRLCWIHRSPAEDTVHLFNASDLEFSSPRPDGSGADQHGCNYLGGKVPDGLVVHGVSDLFTIKEHEFHSLSFVVCA